MIFFPLIALLFLVTNSYAQEGCGFDKYQSTIQKSIDEEDLFGDWFTEVKKINNHIKSKPYLVGNNIYSFNRDYSILIVIENEKMKGSWALSKNNELKISISNEETVYEIVKFEYDRIILADSHRYLILHRK